MKLHRAADEELLAMHKDIYMPMLQTAEVVAARYNVSRDAMDEYGLQSQQRAAAAYEAVGAARRRRPTGTTARPSRSLRLGCWSLRCVIRKV